MSRRTQSNQSRRRQTNRAGNPQRRRKVHTKYKFSTRRMYQRTFIALGAIVLFALVLWAGRSGWGRVKGMNMRRSCYHSKVM